MPSDFWMAEARDAYVECALWASVNEDGVPFDSGYTSTDISPDSIAAMHADVHTFLGLCAAGGIDVTVLDPQGIGHDLWLTRNGHGAGFWDRGLGELGERLSGIARTMGESDLYTGDDGLIHVYPERVA